MKRIGYLFEQIADAQTLRQAALAAAKGKPLRPSIAAYLVDLEGQSLALARELQEGRYRPGPYTIFWIYEGKPRRICAAPFRDRVVHHAICSVLEPLWERYAIFDSYACRRGKGTHKAVQRAQAFCRRSSFFLHLDIRKFFESIDHAVLQSLLRRQIKDPRALALLDFVIASSPLPTQGIGLPIGNLTSQHFANLYLGQMDHFLKETLRIKLYLRYMDDFVLFADEKDTLWRFLYDLEEFLQSQLRLRLHPRKLLAPISEGLPFLGFQIRPEQIRLRPLLLRQIAHRLRSSHRAFEEGHLPEARYLRRLHSLLGHLSHADTDGLCVGLFRSLWHSEALNLAHTS